MGLAANLGPAENGVHRRSLWYDAWRKLIANRLALASVFVLCIVLLLASFGTRMTPYGYRKQDLDRIAEVPSWAHPLGTDDLGRDMLSRVVTGGRTAIVVAVVSTVISGVLGVLLGSLAAYLGGWVDTVIVRVIDVLLGFPHLLLAVLLAAWARPFFAEVSEYAYAQSGWAFVRSTVYVDYLAVFAVLGLIGWPRLARLTRGQVLSLRETDYVMAARAVGSRTWYITVRHLIPNAIGPVVVVLSADFGRAMLLESSLSYLGMGVQPPAPSWGRMIIENLMSWRYRPHLVLMPGLALFITVLAITFFGDGLNDALNPRTLTPQKKR
jgi:peptide/nickel transport system permease protein